MMHGDIVLFLKVEARLGLLDTPKLKNMSLLKIASLFEENMQETLHISIYSIC